jgi:hypothetical protein
MYHGESRAGLGYFRFFLRVNKNVSASCGGEIIRSVVPKQAWNFVSWSAIKQVLKRNYVQENVGL